MYYTYPTVFNLDKESRFILTGFPFFSAFSSKRFALRTISL